MTKIPENNRTEKQILLFKRVAYITGSFSILIALLLIINFLQLKTSDPLELKSLETLVKQYDNDPQNEDLKEEIRSLDLLARRAYFTKEWQLQTGGYLLLAFLAISLISFRMIHSLKFKLSIPEEKKKENEWQIKSLARNSMVYIGIFLAGLIMVVYIFSNNEFSKYLSNNLAILSDSTKTLVSPGEKKETNPSNDENSELINISTQVEEVISKSEDNNLQKETEQVTDEPLKNESTGMEAKLKQNHIAFRGYRGLGKSYNKNIPVDWDGTSGRNIKWKTLVPRSGYSSPIIWDDFLFMTGADKTAREVYCFNRFTGKILWTTLVDNIPGSPDEPPKTTDDTGLAAPTMTTDGTCIFAIFATGDIICLDMKGKRIWAKNLGVPKNHYGHSSSLISYKNLLYIQYDDSNSGKLIALDTKTGNEFFRTIRKSSVSWTSPILIQRGNLIEVVIDSDPGVAGYNALTGTENWMVECLYGEIGASPAYNGKNVFVSNEYAKMVAVEPGTNAQILWEGYDYLPEVSSPVANKEFVITATSYGDVGCFDASTGNVLWNQNFNNGFYASPIIAEGKIYLIDIQGTMYIIKESVSYELIAKPELGEKVVCTPAFADGYIYIRGEKNLYCISSKK